MIGFEHPIASVEAPSPTRVVIPFTYSARREGNTITPSRLSLMAYDVACYEATRTGADRIIIAGEQSYSDIPTTTGELLTLEVPFNTPSIEVLRNDRNCLINTAFQAEALAARINHWQLLTVVGWGFHLPRIKDNLRGHDDHFIHAHYVDVEAVIDGLWASAGLWGGDTERRDTAFKERYDLKVEWPTVRDDAIVAFKAREQTRTTRLVHALSPGGSLPKLISKFTGTGRYDDIDPWGAPIMTTAKKAQQENNDKA